MEINKVVIVGGGPVGSFTAVLMSKFGLPVTVYEKRQTFTRAINVKVNKELLEDIQGVCDATGMADSFFRELKNELSKQNHKILIKTLEEKLRQEAEKLGAMYITREVKDFAEVYDAHKHSQPIILDCTGRNSPLRTSTFGEDAYNIESLELDSVLYINLTASVAVTNVSLYSAMENVKYVKLARLLASKQANGLTSITIVACVTKELDQIFEKSFGNTNRNPIKPFSASTSYVPDEIFQCVSALISPLMVEGSHIDLDSVTVKKINITCGYAKQRSQDRLICLGDAAAHLAYFLSLNLGLKHALNFFVTLSKYCKTEGVVTEYMVVTRLVFNRNEFREDYVLEQFKAQNPHLTPVQALVTHRRGMFLVVSKIIWYGCYSYDVASKATKQLTGVLGVKKHQIPVELEKLNKKLDGVGSQNQKEKIIDEFTNDVKMLLSEFVSKPVDVYNTKRKDNYLVVTKALWFGCYWYDLASHKVKRLTDVSGISESEIPSVLGQLNGKFIDWKRTLHDFETERQNDIQHEISSNRSTQSQYDFAADIISLHTTVSSFIPSSLTVTGLYSHIRRGYVVSQGDTEYFCNCLKVVRENVVGRAANHRNHDLVVLETILKLGKISEGFNTKSLLKNIDDCRRTASTPAEQVKLIKQLMYNTAKHQRGALDLLNNGYIKLDFLISCINQVLKDVTCNAPFECDFENEVGDGDDDDLLLLRM